MHEVHSSWNILKNGTCWNIVDRYDREADNNNVQVHNSVDHEIDEDSPSRPWDEFSEEELTEKESDWVMIPDRSELSYPCSAN